MKLWSHAEFLAQTFPEPAMLVRPIITRGTTVLLHGQPEAGKTAFALTLAEAVARGAPLLDEFACPRAGPVIIVELDMPLREYHERWQTTLASTTADLPIHHITADDANILRETPYKPLQEANELNPALVLVDALVDTHELDENSATTAKRVLGAFRRYFPRATRVFVHHDAKEVTGLGSFVRAVMQKVRGSGAWAGSCSTALHFERCDTKDGEWRTKLSFSKGRNIPHGAKQPLTLALDEETLTLKLAAPTLAQQARAYIKAAGSGVTKSEVAGSLRANGRGPSRATAYRIAQEVLSELEEAK